MIIRFWIVCLCLFPSLLNAQVFSKEGRFSVPFAKGCAPLQINVSEHDSFGNITRQYFYEPGARETIAKTYTYNTPGVYKVVQIVGIDVVPKTDTLTIEVLEPVKPTFELRKCSSSGIYITSKETTYDFIRVFFTPNDSVTLNANQSASFNYPSTSTQSFQVKGYYTNAQSNCGSLVQTVTPLSTLVTPTVTSASVKETCKDRFTLTLNVNHFDPEVNYEVVLSQTQSQTVYSGFISSNKLVIPNVPVQTSSASFCVRINATDPCTSTSVTSTPFCRNLSSLTLSPFETFYSSYENDGIAIHIDSVATGSLLLYRQQAGGEFVFRDTIRHSYTDPIGSNTRRYTYRVDYLDSCKQVLYQGFTHPPLLSATRLEDNVYLIDYTPPKNTISFSPDVTYSLGSQAVKSEPVLSQRFELRLTIDQGIIQPLSTQVSYENGIRINSNRIALKYKPVIHVPTAFTPNGDGLNDALKMFGLPSSSVTVKIYSRWGQLVHTTNKSDLVWDGMINGTPAPGGTYLYEVIFPSEGGKMIRQKGTFVLLKK